MCIISMLRLTNLISTSNIYHEIEYFIHVDVDYANMKHQISISKPDIKIGR